MSKPMPVRGDVQPATEAGFAHLIQRANEVLADGLQLVGIVNIGADKLGAVYVRTAAPKPQANLID